MKKILIVSYLFAPENAVGAIRPTKLAKYLALMGYDIHVITTSYNERYDEILAKDSASGFEITKLNHSPLIKKYLNRNTKVKKINRNYSSDSNIFSEARKKNVFTLKLKKILTHLINICISYDFYYNYKKCLNNLLLDKKFDVIITSYGPIASVLCGIYYKKKNDEVNWISDFRDPMVGETFPDLLNKFNLSIQENAIKKADRVVAVSKGYLERICKGRYYEKSFIITNGFDESDLSMDEEVLNDNKFTFTYTGYLYRGKRDLSVIFECIHDLIRENLIDSDDIVFNYAGKDYSSLYSQANQFGLQHLLVDYGLISREESLKLQKKSRYLVLATWNNENEIGVFPGKFLEYMFIGKPIISLVSGKLPDSEVTRVMQKTNLGITYEEVYHEKDYKILKEYLKKEYWRFKKGLNSEFNPNKEIINKYTYENIAIQYRKLF
ncbi:hypothetical protein DHX103_03805 [Planococcus sp. X10-3]|uniref:hypothetical protein n=1 Tax=Planococcus sp. X10-3 TaxID=3061240 RepID=UPI003BAF7C36